MKELCGLFDCIALLCYNISMKKLDKSELHERRVSYMAVKNFYVEANIDGRATTLGGGPAAKDGEMTVCIHQRNEGCIMSNIVKVYCKVLSNGKLVTKVYCNDELRYTIETTR